MPRVEELEYSQADMDDLSMVKDIEKEEALFKKDADYAGYTKRERDQIGKDVDDKLRAEGLIDRED